MAAIISHPSYNKPIRLSNDIALLKLAQPARLGKGIGLVCLGSEEYDVPLFSNSKCFITGWGTLASGGNQPNALMQASVPLVSKQRCLAAYPQKIDDSMLCAGLDQGGVDACQGDSGGPLVCEHRPHRWFLEGATSWGWGCAVPGKFGVYARVRHFRKWLMETMNLSPTQPGRLPDRINRGTQRFVSGNICSGDLNRLRNSDLIPVKTRDLFGETSPQTFVTRGVINSFCFRKDRYVVQGVK